LEQRSLGLFKERRPNTVGQQKQQEQQQDEYSDMGSVPDPKIIKNKVVFK